VANGHGGKRNGAGRPRGVNSRRGLAIEGDWESDAKEAMALIRQFMQDTKLPARLRFDCAREILDRRIGRPPQHKTVDATVSILKGYEGISPDDWDDDDSDQG